MVAKRLQHLCLLAFAAAFGDSPIPQALGIPKLLHY
jgi:hypothetical protein